MLDQVRAQVAALKADGAARDVTITQITERVRHSERTQTTAQLAHGMQTCFCL